MRAALSTALHVCGPDAESRTQRKTIMTPWMDDTEIRELVSWLASSLPWEPSGPNIKARSLI